MKLSSFALLSTALLVTPIFAAPLEDTGLDKRAWNCKGAFQCRGLRKPPNSTSVCQRNICTYVCNTGFERNGVRCLDSASLAANSTSMTSTSTVAAPATTTSSPTTTSTSTTLIVSSTTTSSAQPYATLTPNALAAAGVTGFQGLNTNAILSWFKTNLATDSTNGNSWCGYPYTDEVPGFAPSVGTMLANFNWNYEAAAKAYCGLEAVVMTPDGRNMTMYLADGFDVKWLITPTSLDIVYGSFDKLFGRVTNNKNDVVKQGSWYFTGNRNERYKFKGQGARGL